MVIVLRRRVPIEGAGAASSPRPRDDLTGRRFGLLVCVARKNTTTWECVCDCGALVHVSGDDLRGGKRASCGCVGRMRQAREEAAAAAPAAPVRRRKRRSGKYG